MSLIDWILQMAEPIGSRRTWAVLRGRHVASAGVKGYDWASEGVWLDLAFSVG